MTSPPCSSTPASCSLCRVSASTWDSTRAVVCCSWPCHESTRWPKLAALRARLEADPAVVYATALESGESALGSGLCRGHLPLADVIARYGA